MRLMQRDKKLEKSVDEPSDESLPVVKVHRNDSAGEVDFAVDLWREERKVVSEDNFK